MNRMCLQLTSAMLIMLGGSIAVAAPVILLAENEAVPGEPGEFFDYFGTPVIDDTGSVYVYTSWSVVPSDGGIWRWSSRESNLLIRDDSLITGLPYRIEDINGYTVAEAGLDAGIWVNTDARPPNTSYEAIFRYYSGGIESVHNDGDPDPFGFGTASYIQANAPTVNNNGFAAISASLAGTPGGASDDRALYLSGASTSILLARRGATQPGGGVYEPNCSNSLAFFCRPELNDTGGSVFLAEDGAFFHDGNAVHAVARDSFISPDGGEFNGIATPRLNDEGGIVFCANTSGNSSYDHVFTYRDGALDYLPTGGPAPASDGSFFGEIRYPASYLTDIADTGSIVFCANTYEPRPDGTGNRWGEGLFIVRAGQLESVARVFESDPEGDVFDDFSFHDQWLINDHDQVLFRAIAEHADGNRRSGIYLYTPGEGTERVVATGDIIDGQIVESISDIALGYSGAGSLNNRGEVAIHVRLDTGDAIIGYSLRQNCAADMNGDAMLNFFDVSTFLVAYQSADPIADMNEDGMFNFFDVSAFLVAYQAGCP